LDVRVPPFLSLTLPQPATGDLPFVQGKRLGLARPRSC
jgi:hypothetical protein